MILRLVMKCWTVFNVSSPTPASLAIKLMQVGVGVVPHKQASAMYKEVKVSEDVRMWGCLPHVLPYSQSVTLLET